MHYDDMTKMYTICFISRSDVTLIQMRPFPSIFYPYAVIAIGGILSEMSCDCAGWSSDYRA